MLSHYAKRAEGTLQKRPGNKFPVVNDFVLLREIGHGAHGTVRLAISLHTMQPVAVKILNKNKAREQSSSMSVKREIAIMQKLQHPNVVKLIDLASTKTRVLLMMEFVEGGELFDEILHFGRLSEPYARFFFQQLVRGLDYCHSNGVYHRDLKPDNLLVDRDKTLKITDFGVGALTSNLQSDNPGMLQTPVGTPNYVAPELIGTSCGYDGAKSDAWSCGVILYLMCSGLFPFDARSMIEIFCLIKRCHVAYPAHFSPELKDLLVNIFQPNPNNRYSLGQMSRHPWFSGPVTTSEVGDDRPAPPSKLEDMKGAIQEVITSYEYYKEKAAVRKGSNVRDSVTLDSGMAPNRIVVPGPSAAAASLAARPEVHDSLAVGVIHRSQEIGMTMTGTVMATADRFAQTQTTINGTHADMHTTDVLSDYNSPPENNSQPEQATNDSDSSPDADADAEADTDTSEVTRHSAGASSNGMFDDSRNSEARRTSPWSSDQFTGSTSRDIFLHSEDEAYGRRTLSANNFGANLELWTEDSELNESDYNQEAGNDVNREKLRLSLWNSLVVKHSASTAGTKGENSDGVEVLLAAQRPRELVRSKSADRIELAAHRKSTRPHHRSTEKLTALWPKTPSEPKYESRRGNGRRVKIDPSITGPSTSQRAIDDEPVINEEHISEVWKVNSNMVWCKFMRDIDAIPDELEHGMTSKELEESWAAKLEQEGIRKRIKPRRVREEDNVSSRFRSMVRGRPPPEGSTEPIEAGVVRTSQATASADVNMAKTTPGVMREESVVIGGDLLTQRGLPSVWLTKFVGKTAFDHDEQEAVTRALTVQNAQGRTDPTYYYNSVMSCAKGESYDVVGKFAPTKSDQIEMGEAGGAKKRDTFSPQIRASTGIDSLLSETQVPSLRTPSRSLSWQKTIAPGLNRIAIGPLHKDYKRDTGQPTSAESDEDSEVERREIAGRLKIFEYDVPGPEHPLTLPSQLPFEKCLRVPVKFVKRHLPTHIPRVPLLGSSPVKYTFLMDPNGCANVLVRLLEGAGATVQQQKKREGKPVLIRARLSKDGTKLVVRLTVDKLRNYATRSPCSTILMRRTSGDREKFAEFAFELQTKLSDAETKQGSNQQTVSLRTSDVSDKVC